MEEKIDLSNSEVKMITNEKSYINIMRDYAKMDQTINLDNKCTYLYHAIFIPYFDSSNSILSIIDSGLITLREQYKRGLITLKTIKAIVPYETKRKRFLSFFRPRKNSDEEFLSEQRNNIIYFSPNKNLFNRVFDISFIVKKDPSFIFKDNGIDEETALKMNGKDDYTEYIKFDFVSPDDFLGIKINFDELINKASIEQRGVNLEEIVPRLVVMINSIYDKLEEKGLNIPIYNSNDNKIISKKLFRLLRDKLSIPKEFFRIFEGNIGLNDYYSVSDNEFEMINAINNNEELLRLLGYSIIRNLNSSSVYCLIVHNASEAYFNQQFHGTGKSKI